MHILSLPSGDSIAAPVGAQQRGLSISGGILLPPSNAVGLFDRTRPRDGRIQRCFSPCRTVGRGTIAAWTTFANGLRF